MKEVLAHWTCPGEAERVSTGTINAVWRVETGAETLFLRAYRTGNVEAVRREHAAIGIARAAGVPTPALLPLPDGQMLLGHDGKFWALFEAAPGEQIERADLGTDHAWAMGAFLAELHARLPERGPEGLTEIRPSSAPHTVQRLQTIRDAILTLSEPDGRDGWALERTEQRLAHLAVNPTPDASPNFPVRFLHGDFQDSNLFFAGGEVSSLIDWENARLAPRAWEVVRGLHLSLLLEPERCAALLDGYRTRSSLPEAELEDGARFYALVQERNLWVYESVYLQGNPAPRAFIHPPPYEPFAVSWARLVAQLR